MGSFCGFNDGSGNENAAVSITDVFDAEIYRQCYGGSAPSAEQLLQERQTTATAYYRSIEPILSEYLIVLERALETVSIDRTMATIQSFSSARENFERILQHQSDVEMLSRGFEAIPAPMTNSKHEIRNSFRFANQGLDSLYTVYTDFAENRGIPDEEALAEFAEQRALSEGLLLAAAQLAEEVSAESKRPIGGRPR